MQSPWCCSLREEPRTGIRNLMDGQRNSMKDETSTFITTPRKISLGTKEAINFTSVKELRFHLLVGLFLRIISEKVPWNGDGLENEIRICTS